MDETRMLEGEYERRINWYLWGNQSLTDVNNRYTLISTLLAAIWIILDPTKRIKPLVPLLGIAISACWMFIYNRISVNQRIRRYLVWEIENVIGRKSPPQANNKVVNLYYLLTEQSIRHGKKAEGASDKIHYDIRKLIDRESGLFIKQSRLGDWSVDSYVLGWTPLTGQFRGSLKVQ
jgi:hypothetical protein